MPAAALSRLTGRWATRVRDGLLVVVVTALVTVLFFRVGSADWGLPIDYRGDSASEAALARVIIETGWTTHTDRLGAPTGQTLHDFPLGGDDAHNLVIKVMSWFIHEPVSLVNAYFLLGFVLVALVAFAVLRWLRVSRALALAGALLFAFAPYHLIRGTAHVTLGAYFSVPLACWLALRVAHGDVTAVEVGPGRRPRLAQGALGVAVVALLIGASNAYYALMLMPLLAVAAAIGALRSDRGRRLAVVVGAAVIAALVLGSLLINNLPALRYQSAHGKNPEVDVRYPWEVDDYALRPVELLSPVPGHHVPALRTLAQRLTTSRSVSEPSQFLGAVAAFGMLLAIGFALALGARRRDNGPWARRPDLPVAGVLIIAAVLIGTAGGLAWFAGVVGFVKVRAWNRISIVIAFLALACVVVLADKWLARRSRRAFVAPALAVALVVVGLFDQTGGLRPNPDINKAEFERDARFIAGIEQTLPAGSMVFELPWQPFPEEPARGSMAQYDQLKPFLHSKTLRWSFGGMRGRESDWQEAAVARPTATMLDAIDAVGFRGLYIDRAGYVGDDATNLVSEVSAALDGETPLTSEDGRLLFFDLRSHHDRLVRSRGDAAVRELATATLDHPTAWWESGFWYEERTYDHVFHNAKVHANATIFNRNITTWNGSFTALAKSAAPGAYGLDIVVEGQTTHFDLTDEWTEIRVPIGLDPGKTAITFTTNAPAIRAPGDPRAIAFALQDAAFVDLEP